MGIQFIDEENGDSVGRAVWLGTIRKDPGA